MSSVACSYTQDNSAVSQICAVFVPSLIRAWRWLSFSAVTIMTNLVDQELKTRAAAESDVTLARVLDG